MGLKTRIAGAALATLLTATAKAQTGLTASDVLDMAAPDHTSKVLWLAGVSEGFLWMNAVRASEAKVGFYCQPRKLSITPPQVYQMLEQYTQEHPDSKSFPAAAALFLAMKETFPCGSAPNDSKQIAFQG